MQCPEAAKLLREKLKMELKICNHTNDLLDYLEAGQGYWKVRCVECGAIFYINAYTGARFTNL